MHRSVSQLYIGGRGTRWSTHLPVIVHTSDDPGPTAVVTANVHGDETVGVGVAHALDRWLQENPFVGRVVLYPSLNPDGLRAASREVPADGGDLNRSFPGRVGPGRTAQLARAIWRELSARAPDAVIDLHADARRAVPYAIVDRVLRGTKLDRVNLFDRALHIAEASGLSVLREYAEDDYIRFRLDRSLAGAVVNVLGVPAVTLEIGARALLEPDVVQSGLDSALGSLAQVGNVVFEAQDRAQIQGAWRRGSVARVTRAGVLVPSLKAGSLVRAGDSLGKVVDIAGEVVEELLAPEDGFLVAWVDRTWVHGGDPVATLAVLDGPVAEAK